MPLTLLVTKLFSFTELLHRLFLLFLLNLPILPPCVPLPAIRPLFLLLALGMKQLLLALQLLLPMLLLPLLPEHLLLLPPLVLPLLL